jgi:hypothetical protein
MRAISSRSQRFRYWRYSKDRRLLLWQPIVVLSFAGVWIAIITVIVAGNWWLWLCLPFLIIALFLVSRLTSVMSKIDRRAYLFQAGAEGESKVTNSLASGLDDSFVLVNGLVLKGQRGDIDHVLVGPTGVFVIETKNYSGYVRCEGDVWTRKPSRSARLFKRVNLSSPAKAVLKDVDAVAGTLAAIQLSAPIMPLVVFPNPGVILAVRKPSVRVLRLEELLPAVKAPKTILTTSEVDSIVDVLTSPPIRTGRPTSRASQRSGSNN